MPLRTTITERQRRLGAELRQLRELSGMSLTQVGAEVGMGGPHLSHVESGRTSITTDRLRALCRAYRCSNEPLIAALVTMAESSGKGWWTEHKKRQQQPALNLAELEAGARRIQSQESLFIPGLFQTEQYMRTTFENVRPKLTANEIDDSSAFRLERQSVLTGEDPPVMHAVIHEAALHMHIGSPEIMRAQLLHLIELARLPNVVIQVFPYEAGVYAALSGTFTLITPIARELSTVLLDHPVRSLYMGDEPHITQYSDMFGKLAELALPPINPAAVPETHSGKSSLGLIQHILYTL